MKIPISVTHALQLLPPLPCPIHFLDQTPQTNLPSSWKLSRTHSLRDHWPTQSSPAGPALQNILQTRYTNYNHPPQVYYCPIFFLIYWQKRWDRQTVVSTLARACLVSSYRLHRENAETMREATWLQIQHCKDVSYNSSNIKSVTGR